MIEEEALDAPGELYRHFKGGIYRKLGEAIDAKDIDRTVAVLEHLWPHEHKLWIRDLHEFHDIHPSGVKRYVKIVDPFVFEDCRYCDNGTVEHSHGRTSTCSDCHGTTKVKKIRR